MDTLRVDYMGIRLRVDIWAVLAGLVRSCGGSTVPPPVGGRLVLLRVDPLTLQNGAPGQAG